MKCAMDDAELEFSIIKKEMMNNVYTLTKAKGSSGF